MEELLIILLLAALNGFFSMAEIAVVTSKRSQLERLTAGGNMRAARALAMSDSPSAFLSTVQIAITLISMVTGVYGGVALTADVSRLLARVAIENPLRDGISVVAVISIITLISLVIGELLPKRIALAYPEAIAVNVAPFFAWLASCCGPLVKLLDFCTETLAKALHVDKPNRAQVTAEEIQYLVAQGAATGALEESEGDIVQEVLRLDDRTVSALMTPRHEVVWLDLDTPLEQAWVTAYNSRHSFFPLSNEDLDDLVGIVAFKDLAVAVMEKRNVTLEDLRLHPVKVPTHTSALTLIDSLKASGESVAVVIDEFGHVAGFVTSDDLMQAIIGELEPEGTVPTGITKREDGTILIDATVDVDEVLDFLNIANPFDQAQQQNYHSFGGFVLRYLGHIPEESDGFEFGNYRFEIIDMDRLRIDKILAIPVAKAVE